MKRIVFSLILAVVAAAPAAAQRLDDAAVAYRPARGALTLSATQSQRQAGSTAGRAFVGVLGFLGGAVVGTAIAHGVMAPCDCDDPGLNELVAGVAFGGTVGSVMGVALPRFNSACLTSDRVFRAMLGTALGFGAAVAMVPLTGGGSLLALPVLAPVGGALLQGRC